MEDSQQQIIIQYLEKISNVLLKTGRELNSLDLLNGKMGIAVFFSHYSRYTNVEIYSDYALELIINIQPNLFLQNPVNCIHELCQIGIGIEYLRQEKYFEVNPEILSDFDDIIYQVLMENILYLSINNVVEIGKYFLFRSNNLHAKRKSKKNIKKVIDLIDMHITVDPLCFREIIDLLYWFSCYCPYNDINRLMENQLYLFHELLMKDDPLRWSNTFLRASKYSEKFYLKSNEINKKIFENPCNYFDYKSDNVINGNSGYLIWLLLTEQKIKGSEDQFINRLFHNKDPFQSLNLGILPLDMGILKGYAGVGLTLLSLLDKKHLSWINLL